MFWMLMLDIFLAMGFWLGFDLDRPIADVYSHCYANACQCSKDSPCKKGCTKDDCCCFERIGYDFEGCCSQAVCPPAAYPQGFCPHAACQPPACPQAVCPQAVCPAAAYPQAPCQPPACMPSCCPQACCPQAAYPQTACPPCPATMPIASPFSFPRSWAAPPAPSAPFYVVEMQFDKNCAPKMMLPAGHSSVLKTANPNCPGSHNRIDLQVRPVNDGCVRVEMRLDEMKSVGCGGMKRTWFEGCKEVSLDTVSNVVLSGSDPEPRSVQVLVKAAPAPANVILPPSMTCPASPPMPPRAAFIPPPMPICPPQVCLPEPLGMPVPLQAPVYTPLPPVTTCAAVTYPTPARPAVHVELVRCCHESKLCMKNGDTCATFTKMTLSRGECASVTLTAGKKFAHIKGKQWKAQADSIDIQPDGRVILTGHVKLDSESIGVGASVKADKLCVQVSDGKLVKIVNMGSFAPER